jgi:hypothetical protein
MSASLFDIARPTCPKCGQALSGIVSWENMRLRCRCGWREFGKKSGPRRDPAEVLAAALNASVLRNHPDE